MSQDSHGWRPRLKQWPQGRRERQAYIDPIFATIATRYDFMTRVLSLGQEQRWKSRAVSLIPGHRSPQRVLDLACGTGDFAVHLRRAGFESQLVGLDRNPEMIRCARKKCAREGRVDFLRGDLMRIPFQDCSFDAITMGYGLRYVVDIRQTLREVFRLLRSGGIFVCLEFGIPKNPVYRRLCFGYLLLLGSLWGLILHGSVGTYWHIVESLEVYPGQETIGKWIEETGFRQVQLFQKLGGIITLFSGTRP